MSDIELPTISPRRMALKRFVGHKAAVVSCVVLGIFLIIIILLPITTRYGVNQAVRKPPNSFLPPQKIAWLGTDDIGRDIYSRLIYGIRVSMIIGLASAIIAVAIGCVVGAVAGFRGGFFDDVVMRITDLFLAFPFLVALLVVRNMLGALNWLAPLIGDSGSIRFIIFLLALFGWMTVARIVRGQVLSLKEREFIESARAVGASRRYIIMRHLLPNSIGPIMVALTFSVVGAIIGEATLSFFGYGPQAGSGTTSLGLLVGASRFAVQSGFWW
ncbi:MAG: ABC transporter permease, partial [Ilumatobacteraceae bacterium]